MTILPTTPFPVKKIWSNFWSKYDDDKWGHMIYSFSLSLFTQYHFGFVNTAHDDTEWSIIKIIGQVFSKELWGMLR